MKHNGNVAQKQRSHEGIIVLVMVIFLSALYWAIQDYEQDAQTDFVNQESLRLNAEAERFRDTLQKHIQVAVVLGKLAGESGTQAAVADALRALMITPPSYLQSRRNRSYFKDSIALNRGDVYVSSIELNRERIQPSSNDSWRNGLEFTTQGKVILGLVVVVVTGVLLQLTRQGRISAKRASLAEHQSAMSSQRNQGLEQKLDEKSQQIRQRQAELEAANRELIEKRRQAEAAALAKSQFLANMSHEIRTPMNAIIGILHLLQESDINPKAKDLARKGYLSAEGLLNLLNSVLDLSRIESEDIEFEHADFSLDSLIKGSVDAFSDAAKEKANQLDVVIAPGTPTLLKGDLMRTTQIISNLVDNAVKFTEQGTASVHFRVDPRQSHAGDIPSGLLIVKVADTGIGIPEDKFTAIFEDFRQVDAGASRHYGGTGLGLAISSRLCRLLGGELSVESTMGKGSAFTLRLPIQLSGETSHDTHQTALAPSSPKSTTSSFSNIKALVVDDVDLNCEVVALYLTALGIDTRWAATGEQAMNALNAESIDLIFMDLQLDGETGQALTRSIRQRSVTQPIIIGMSASLSETDRTSAMACGMDAFLAKPFSQEDIRKVVWQFFTEGEIKRHSVTATTTQPPNTDDLPEFMQPERAIELASWNQSLLLQCLKSYSDSCRETLDLLHQTGYQHDTASVLRFSHRIRGAAASLGDNEMQEKAKQLDLRTREGSDSGTENEQTALASLARQRISQIQTYLAHYGVPDEALIDGSEDFESALRNLKMRMSTNRAADVSDIAVVTGFLVAKGRGETANDLRQAIESYDFAHALNLLELETLTQT